MTGFSLFVLGVAAITDTWTLADFGAYMRERAPKARRKVAAVLGVDDSWWDRQRENEDDLAASLDEAFSEMGLKKGEREHVVIVVDFDPFFDFSPFFVFC